MKNIYYVNTKALYCWTSG